VDEHVDIVMRSFNEAWALKGTLEALESQTYSKWRLTVIDSGSTDGTLQLLENFPVHRLIQISPGSYIPGKVLNLGMESTTSGRVVFLNADATPANERWLELLISGARGAENLAAGFGRQVPRPDCRLPFRRDYDDCFGPQRKSASWNHFFSMVSSIIDRECWLQRGFREDIMYAEDHDFSLYWRMNGRDIVYIEQATVIHSHNYNLEQCYRRSMGDAHAIALCGLDKSVTEKATLSRVLTGCVKDWVMDLIYGMSGRWDLYAAVSFPTRFAQRYGKWIGLKQYAKELRHQVPVTQGNQEKCVFIP
jgi:rhamnosyltransferase